MSPPLALFWKRPHLTAWPNPHFEFSLAHQARCPSQTTGPRPDRARTPFNQPQNPKGSPDAAGIGAGTGTAWGDGGGPSGIADGIGAGYHAEWYPAGGTGAG